MKVLQAIRVFVVLTLFTGVAYPLAVSLTARIFFPAQARGSIVLRQGVPVGSALLAQKFESPRYFHPRPSACDYNTLPSGGSNYGPTSAALKKIVLERAAKVRTENALSPADPVPACLLFASGSGLDPHISPSAAAIQMDRIAQARGFTAFQRAKLEILVRNFIERPQFGFLGEPRINVLLLNLALDAL